jgi:nicotinamidase-related amidase
MPAKNPDLHGNVPDSSPVALLLIDVINDLEFETGAKLLAPALKVARRIAALKANARKRGIPVIYANDNFGRWRSDFREAVRHCLEDGVRGQPLAALLKPDAQDYFVLKTKHSAFYSTTLELLLDYLKTKHLIITGFSTDACVLMTASDAYMRDLRLSVPQDCVASASKTDHRQAVQYMARHFTADTAASQNIDLAKLKRSSRARA